MSNKSFLPADWPQKALPHVAVLLVALAIIFAYFSPVTKDQVLRQTDLIQHRGMSKEIKEYRAKKGEEPLWGANMFSGMPTYQYGASYSGHLFNPVSKVLKLGLPRPTETFFLLFLGFYILLLSLRLDPWMAGAGALAFMMSSFFFVSIEAGHTSKIYAVAYMPMVIAGVLMAYRGKLYLGAALTALGMGLEISANHFQITYYMMFVLGALVLGRGIYDFKKGKIAKFAKVSGVLLLALTIGILANLGKVLTTYEYSEYTIRGPEIIKTADGGSVEKQIFEPRKKSGLKPNYAFQWSNGPVDVLTFLSPYIAGGASGDDIGENSETHEILKRTFGAKSADQIVQRYPTYWGELPFTSGPVYAGAVVLFLFVLGLIIVDNKYRWWILGITILAILLSMGKHFLPLSKFLFNYLPMYNKFRAPSMMLVVVEFTLPLLGFLALKKFLSEGVDKEKMKKALFIAAGSTAGLLLILLVGGSSIFDFSTGNEAGTVSSLLDQLGASAKEMGKERHNKLVSELAPALIADRASMFQMDALRTIAFILAGAGALFVYLRGMITRPIVIGIIAVLILIDMWPVNRRYLNDENFIKRSEITKMFKKTNADLEILADSDPHYRVFKMGGNMFQEALTSYHHKSIGGYHAAKLRRYQDLVDHGLGNYLGQISQVFQSAMAKKENPIQALQGELKNMPILNMLNCKYIIFNPSASPVVNPHNLGEAWFVRQLKAVNSPLEEANTVSLIDPAQTAIYEAGSPQTEGLSGYTPQFDPSATIKLTSFDQKHMEYQSNASKEQFAVFSEVYYDYGVGWNAYIDGQPAEHYRVNYLLRGMKVPAGNHKIEFKFEPSSYHTGNTISLIFSLLAFIGIGAGVYFSIKKKGESEAEEADQGTKES